MNLFECNECVKFLFELYPAMTAEQGRALRDDLARRETTVEAFKAAARRVVIKHPYANNALAAIADQLEANQTFTAAPRVRTWLDEANERNRREREAVAAQHARDDELIARLPAVELEAVVNEVAEAMDEPIRSLWKRKGLASRAVRCAVGARLRKEVSHAAR